MSTQIPTVQAGVVECQTALEALSSVEKRVYTGNHGSVGMDGAAHPSILYRLLDPKTENDNGLLGNTQALVNEVKRLESVCDLEDDDFRVVQEESMATTGYSFIARVEVLIQKMEEAASLLAGSGVKNAKQATKLVDRIDEVVEGLESLYEHVGSIVVVFPDPGLEKIIRRFIHKPTGDITLSDLEPLIGIGANVEGISDLTGLEYCINFELLNLEWNQISDLSPLAGLTNLWYLQLGMNQISDIGPLAGLTNLERLKLYINQISDISPLAGLTNLEILHLGVNQISDISPLAGLTNLQDLSLGMNQISDISPLAGLTNLERLDLYENQISDIGPLAGLTNLERLILNDNQISDISPLVGLTNLQVLHLQSNPLNDEAINVIIPALVANGVIVYY